ncbi:MAG TPA: class IV adenylate cyclase [Bacillota bacterium]|nr:class IV adenylate cyclase [Bacillota bacterium]HQC35699.1 class IV adenylate cyclase [Bacillota bacterium]
MLETEIKARLDIPVNQLRATVEGQGYEFQRETAETDHYFFVMDNGKPLNDSALRIRQSKGDGQEKTFLTYKGPKELKTRPEIEFGIESAEAAEAFLLALGHRKALTVRKTRCYYTKGRVTVSVDTVDGLGDFIELETLSSDANDMQRDEGMLLDELQAILPDAKIVEETYLHLLMQKKY